VRKRNKNAFRSVVLGLVHADRDADGERALDRLRERAFAPPNVVLVQ
jgi:hypothetical protein